MFGLSGQDYQFIKDLLRPLVESGAKVWCFGSRARGDYRPYSDLDLMIESENDLKREIGELQEALEESRLPFKVDVLQEKDFASSYFPGYLQDRRIFVAHLDSP